MTEERCSRWLQTELICHFDWNVCQMELVSIDCSPVVDFPQKLLQISLSTFKAIKFAANALKTWRYKSSIRCLFRLEMPATTETVTVDKRL